MKSYSTQGRWAKMLTTLLWLLSLLCMILKLTLTTMPGASFVFPLTTTAHLECCWQYVESCTRRRRCKQLLQLHIHNPMAATTQRCKYELVNASESAVRWEHDLRHHCERWVCPTSCKTRSTVATSNTWRIKSHVLTCMATESHTQ